MANKIYLDMVYVIRWLRYSKVSLVSLIKDIKYILWYIVGTLDLGLKFHYLEGIKPKLIGYSDTSFTIE